VKVNVLNSFVVPPSVGAAVAGLLMLTFTLARWSGADESAARPEQQLPAKEQQESAPANEPPTADESPKSGEAPASAAPQQAAPIPVELQPCRVQVLIAFDNVPEFSAEFRQSVLDGVRDGLERFVGEHWHSMVTEERGKIFSGQAALKRLRVETIPRAAVAEDVQKVYLLHVHSSGAGFDVAGREWDVLTHRLGAVVVNSAYDWREIGETLLAVVHDVYRPVGTVEASKSGAITLRARGGEFPPRDGSWQPLLPGKTFETFYCFLNKDRTIERIQQVPFTFLAPGEGADRGVVSGTLTSGLRAPLTPRRRIQVLALGISRRQTETRLTLITRPPSRKPLAGVEVDVSPGPIIPDESPKAKESVEERSPKVQDDTNPGPGSRLPRFVADRNGLVTLKASLSPTGQPVWLFVRSGQALLARVPIVPGAQIVEVLELPDDTLRLETEGNIASLQAELVDAVARRAVLMSLARARAKANDWPAVTELLKQLDEMPKAPVFAAGINAIRVPALKTARARRDRTTEARIQKLCDESAELVTNYLDDDKLKDLREELHEMRQLAVDEAAVEAQAKEAESKPPPPEDEPDSPQDAKAAPPEKPKGF